MPKVRKGKKSKAVFCKDQFVFAKVKGFAPWPAKILGSQSKDKYSVVFFGKNEKSNVAHDSIWSYKENRDKFNTESNLKKAAYKEAVDLIEDELLGLDESEDDFDMDKNQDKENKSVDISQDLEDKSDENMFESNDEKSESDLEVKTTRKEMKNKLVQFKVKEDEFVDPLPKVDQAQPSGIEQNQFKTLNVQRKMIRAINDLRKHLSHDGPADLDASLELMKQFKQEILPGITQFMLIKYSVVVETFEDLERYIGPINIDDYEKVKEKSQQIRTLASEILAHIKGLFTINDKPFFGFQDSAADLKARARNVNVGDYFEALSADELAALVAKTE